MPRRRELEDDYKYMQVADALPCINQQVNLIGIVIETTLPKCSKGTDLSCSMKIIGESRPDLGISVMFFAETIEKFPNVESVGDIILISKVKMRTRGSEVYAMYLKHVSSFALYEGRDYSGKEFVPYQMSPRFQGREQDKRLVTGLRKWLIHNKIEGLNDVLSMREIKEGERINLLGKILHACEVKEDEVMLYLWDGTDTPPTSIETKYFPRFFDGFVYRQGSPPSGGFCWEK